MLSFRRKPESSVFKSLWCHWTPVFTGVTTFYESIKYWYQADSASERFSFLHAGLITTVFHKIFRKFIERFKQRVPGRFDGLEYNLVAFLEYFYLISRNSEFLGQPYCLRTTILK